MKTFKVKPAEVIGLEFEDGTVIEMCFNMKALATLGDLVNNKQIALIGPGFWSGLIYAGVKAMNPDFTIEESNALYIQLSEAQPDAMTAILEEYCKAANIDQEALKKNAIAQILR